MLLTTKFIKIITENFTLQFLRYSLNSFNSRYRLKKSEFDAVVTRINWIKK